MYVRVDLEYDTVSVSLEEPGNCKQFHVVQAGEGNDTLVANALEGAGVGRASANAGHVYVKVSAAYRSSEKSPAYDDVAPLARALIDANPERILWGTDWPHPHAAAPGATL